MAVDAVGHDNVAGISGYREFGDLTHAYVDVVCRGGIIGFAGRFGRKRGGNCSQLVDLILGGDEAIDVEERKRRRHIVAVGKGGDSALGRRKKGPQVANTILRQLEVELRSRDIDFLLCVVPEWYTSQKCPRANCVDENGNRSQCRYIIHENGRDELRVFHCTGCGGIFHRDGTGINNNVVQARCYVVLDAAFFGQDWTEYFEV